MNEYYRSLSVASFHLTGDTCHFVLTKRTHIVCNSLQSKWKLSLRLKSPLCSCASWCGSSDSDDSDSMGGQIRAGWNNVLKCNTDSKYHSKTLVIVYTVYT